MAAVVTREAEILTPDTLPPPWGAPDSLEPEPGDPAVSIEIRREPVSGYVATAERSAEARDSEPPPILASTGAEVEAPAAPEQAPEAAAEQAPRAEEAQEPPAQEEEEPPPQYDDVRDSELAPAMAAEVAEAKKESAPPPSVSEPEHEPEPEREPEPEPEPVGLSAASAEPMPSAEPEREEAKPDTEPPPPIVEAKKESAPPPRPKAEPKIEPPQPPSAREAAKPAPAVAAPSRNGVRYVAVAIAVVAGLCIGVYSNQQSVKGPTRELGERVERVEATRVEMRADLESQKVQLRSTQDQVKQLSAKVDAESVARKSDHAKLERDMTTLHDTVKKQNATTDARIQRLREALGEMEMIQEANASRASKK
jgi:hypothetical protein